MTTKEAFDTVVNVMRKEGFSSDKILEILSGLFGKMPDSNGDDAMNQIPSKVEESIIFKEEEEVLTEKEKEHKLKMLFLEIGVPRKLSGYRYLVTGVMLYEKNPFQLVTKDVYPEIAKKYGTTASRVERAMRHAIEVTCARCNNENMYKLFGNTLLNEKCKPTNAEFLSICAEWLTR